MLALTQLYKFRGGSRKSHSLIIDFYQVYMRNFLLFGFGMAMARQLFGPNIICLLQSRSITQDFVDAKCFLNGTMTKEDDGFFQHSYYQWISIVLLIMAFTFHFPFAVWSRWYEYFLGHLEKNIKDVDACDVIRRIVVVSKGDYLFWKTRALEMFYVFYLMLHVLLLDMFFNKRLSQAGWSWNVIPQLFPDSGWCFINYFSGSGEITGKFVCLLPLSTIFRKIFYVLYTVVMISILLHVASFLYNLSLIIKLGRKNVDIWWCLHVAKRNAETYEAHKKLENIWREWMPGKHLETFKDEEYMHMNTLA